MPCEHDEPEYRADDTRQDARAARKGDVEVQDIDQYGREDDQAERDVASNQQQEAAEDLKREDDYVEMGRDDGAKELSGQPWDRRLRQEVKKCVQAKEYKDEAQQDACDEYSDLHRSP